MHFFCTNNRVGEKWTDKKKIEPSVQRIKTWHTLKYIYLFFLNYIHPHPTSKRNKRNYFKQKHLIDNSQEKYEHDFICIHTQTHTQHTYLSKSASWLTEGIYKARDMP